MKRIILTFVLLLTCMITIQAQGMSDEQVIQFIAQEKTAGTSQSQIITKLMQRGVKIDQIRRLRNKYDKQITSRGMQSAADGAMGMAAERMGGNNDGVIRRDIATDRETTTGMRGTSGEVKVDAKSEVEFAEDNVKATQTAATDASDKRVFGRDIFSQANPSFQPNTNMPIPTTYVLGTGDQVVVDIYGASQQTLIHTISPEGTITVTGYGPIYLSGLTVAAAQEKLKKTIGSRYQSSNLKVSVGNTRTIQVNIMGEVKAPGTYHLSAFANVFYALYRAGGISDLGSLRNIKVFRNGKLITVVDIYDYILNGRLAGNIDLKDNDVIQVPPYDCLVGITGNVKRPMFYEMRDGESVVTLLNYAGGFTGDAHKKSVRLVRQTGERYTVHNIGEFEMSTFKLEDGDAITVDGMINRYDNMVEVKGAVFRPGQFQLGTNITTVKTLIEAAEGVTEDAFTGHAVLHRLKEDRSLEILPIDLQGILDGKLADVPLKNEDVLFVPTQEDLIKERSLTITGEVMSPGTYEFADNTTIEDLIVQAGGLRDNASLARVDVSRRILDPLATEKSKEISKSFSFSIKNGLLIDGDRSFLLEPYDVVHVRRSPAYQSARNLTISGEVNFEGSYTMDTKKVRLSDLVQKAGGITEDAYLRGARLTRTLNEEERVRMQATMEAVNNIMSEGRDSLNMTKMKLDSTYVVGIDLEAALKTPGSDKDIILREGDDLYIPEYNASVKVSGEVFYPNTVFYEHNKKPKYYVEQAGGYGHRAKKSKAFIIYQNGLIGMVKKGAKPEPGCEIVVPSKKKRTNNFNLTGVVAGASALTSIASTAALIINATK